MKRFKNDKGVTLVGLVVTIIIILIILGVQMYEGSDLVGTSKNSKLEVELDMVQHAILERSTQYKVTKDESILVGNKIDYLVAEDVARKMNITLVGTDGYYELTKSDLKKLGINDSTDEYIVNYEKGEVMNKTSVVTSDGKALYTYATY